MEQPSDQNENDPNRKLDRNAMPMRGVVIWLFVGFLLLMFYMAFSKQDSQEAMPYSPDFIEKVKAGEVRKCYVVDNDGNGRRFVRGELNEIDAKTKKHKLFKVAVGENSEVEALLKEHGVVFDYEYPNPYMLQLMTGVLPFLLIIGLIYFFFIRQVRSMGHGAMSFGKSRAKQLEQDKKKTTFKDVAGIDEAKEEVQEIIEFLKDPKRFQKLGGRIPCGVLLTGPPGTGKTLLAKAIAGEADVPFFSISGSDFVEMFVGIGASRVRDMFEQGKKSSPCIIFIDEIDAVGRSRFSGIGGGHDEREQTLNALLVEMDGFDTSDGVIIVAATNRPEVLDAALLRPGRFDREIMIDLPTLTGRTEILKLHASNIALGSSVDLVRAARGTPGLSGADLANMLNEAALLAARANKECVEMEDLEEARDKVRWGRECRSRMLDEKEQRITAFHEMGHALVMLKIEDSEALHKVTIIPRGMSLGATMTLPEKDQYTQGEKKLQAMLAGLMGGRAAEELVFDDVTTGASNDLKQATAIARHMVCDWGMSDELGAQSFSPNEDVLLLGREVARQRTLSEDTARRIDAEVSRLLDAAHERAVEILRAHLEPLTLLSEILLEQETLDGREVAKIVELGRRLTDEERKKLMEVPMDDEADDEVADASADAPGEETPAAPTETAEAAAPENADTTTPMAMPKSAD